MELIIRDASREGKRKINVLPSRLGAERGTSRPA
jgi:hypothetical protein